MNQAGAQPREGKIMNTQPARSVLSRSRRMGRTVLGLLAAIAVCTSCRAQGDAPTLHWVGSWAAAQQIPEPQNSLPPAQLTGATLREVVHLSLGGATLRIHLSNAFGTAPLRISSVHIARPASLADGSIDPATDRAVTFDGSAETTIPAGADEVSDPVDFAAAPLSNLAVSMYLEAPPAGETAHPGSRETSFVVHGNLVSAAQLPGALQVEHWYQLSGVDVEAPEDASAVVTLGDSITDGHASTTNGNDRWPDVLAQQLAASAATRLVGVLNEGIGGNRLLLDGLGPNAMARFDRDVLAPAGVRYVILLEGVNDLGVLTRDHAVSSAEHAAMVQGIISAYQQITRRAHAHGIEAIGATIMPYGGSKYYHPGAASEADRQAINTWVRAPGHFDAVVDFDRLMQDPQHPDRLMPAYDSGDHLHPSPAGYRVMGDAIPLSLFAIDSR